jgi:hypothetical protein
MLPDLPVYAGCLAAAAAARARRAGPSRPGVLSALASGWAEAAIERQRRTTLAVVITCLPAGWCVIDRDASGRERFIGPTGTAPAHVTRGILR